MNRGNGVRIGNDIDQIAIGRRVRHHIGGDGSYDLLKTLFGAAAFLTVFRNVIFGAASTEALVLRPELAQGLNVAQQNAQAVSRGLFSDYLLPFEILSVILLVALVGAVVLAKTERV